MDVSSNTRLLCATRDQELQRGRGSHRWNSQGFEGDSRDSNMVVRRTARLTPTRQTRIVWRSAPTKRPYPPGNPFAIMMARRRLWGAFLSIRHYTVPPRSPVKYLLAEPLNPPPCLAPLLQKGARSFVSRARARASPNSPTRQRAIRNSRTRKSPYIKLFHIKCWFCK